MRRARAINLEPCFFSVVCLWRLLFMVQAPPWRKPRRGARHAVVQATPWRKPRAWVSAEWLELTDSVQTFNELCFVDSVLLCTSSTGSCLQSNLQRQSYVVICCVAGVFLFDCICLSQVTASSGFLFIAGNLVVDRIRLCTQRVPWTCQLLRSSNCFHPSRG